MLRHQPGMPSGTRMHSQKHSLFRSRIDILILLVGLFWVLPAVAGYRSMVVNATAYNSLPSQTQGNPGQAAWNDKLHPGMHVIAVSRDLIPMGLTLGTKVAIQGFHKDFIVWDKMAAGVKHTIDIYMGRNVTRAKHFGRQKRRIWWYDKKAGH